MHYQRTIVPEDAISLDVETIDTGDASQSLACVAVYARMKRRNGKYSCQFVLSRSNVIPKNMSQPRAKLYAALLNAHAGEVVRRSFYKWRTSSITFRGSQIVLHWINNDEKPFKMWVCNRVIEIARFTSPNQCFYVQSNDMIAAIGTLSGSSLYDVKQSSKWINGFESMELETSQFPMKSMKDLDLSMPELKEIQKETPYSSYQSHSTISNDLNGINKSNVPNEVMERYMFSKYLIDPNRFIFSIVQNNGLPH